MYTDNGTDWDRVGNAIIIYHQQEDHPLWLSREDLEEMLRVLEGEGGSVKYSKDERFNCSICKRHRKPKNSDGLCEHCLIAKRLFPDDPYYK